MIAYPILNFVLPLIFSSFILVDRSSHCTECQNKTEQEVVTNVAIGRSPEIDTEVNSGEYSAVTDVKDAKRKEHKDSD